MRNGTNRLLMVHINTGLTFEYKYKARSTDTVMSTNDGFMILFM